MSRPVTLNTGFLLSDYEALGTSRQFVYQDVFTLYLASGEKHTWTNAQWDITVPPCDNATAMVTYSSRDVLIEGMRFKQNSGQASRTGDPTVSIPVDEQTIIIKPNLNPSSPTLINGIPFMSALVTGDLDGAIWERDRWYFARPGSPGVGGVPVFYGIAGEIQQLGRTQAQMKVRSDMALLNIQMPRNLCQPNCIYTLYDVGCGVSKSANVTHTTVGTSPTRSFIPWTGATAQFTLGEVFFEAGPNINRTATIKTGVPGSGLQLNFPVPFTPLAGDAIAVYPGCDRTYGGGCAYFANQSRFRGHQWVPPVEFGV